MVELIALVVAVFVITLGFMYAVPRAIGGSPRAGEHGGWPDLLGALDSAQQRWFGMPWIVDLVAAIVTLLVLAAGISVFLDPAMIGAEPGTLFGALGLVLIILGLGLLGVVTHLRVRRTGVSNGEGLLIGMSVTGAALTILVLYVLYQFE